MWFRVEAEVCSHWKMARLCEILPRDCGDVALSVWERSVHGMVLRLWCHVAQHSFRNGDVTRIPPEHLARVAGWTGDPKALISALVTSEIVEKRTDHGKTRIVWHGWRERVAPYLQAMERAKKYRARKREEREEKKAAVAPEAKPNGATDHSDAVARFTAPVFRSKK